MITGINVLAGNSRVQLTSVVVLGKYAGLNVVIITPFGGFLHNKLTHHSHLSCPSVQFTKKTSRSRGSISSLLAELEANLFEYSPIFFGPFIAMDAGSWRILLLR